jgi:hypothetical protein
MIMELGKLEELGIRKDWKGRSRSPNFSSIVLEPRCSIPGTKTSELVMNAKDFKRIALSFEGAEEGSHMGAVDFRVDGRIFATLASVKQGYGNLMLNMEQQAAFVEELPEIFLPIAGGWGRMGMTHIRLAEANEDVLTGALHTAWKLRVEKNAKSGKKKSTSFKPLGGVKSRPKKR